MAKSKAQILPTIGLQIYSWLGTRFSYVETGGQKIVLLPADGSLGENSLISVFFINVNLFGCTKLLIVT